MQLLIVNYHYIREDKYKGGIYPVSLDDLSVQIEKISKQYTFIDQKGIVNEINSHKKTNKNKKYCLLTFDDGLKEQMQAFDFLIKKGIPSMYYVPSNPIQNKTVLDIHKLHYVRSVMSDKEIYEYLEKHYGISLHEFNDAHLKNQYRYDNELARKVKYFLNFVLSDQDTSKVVSSLFKKLITNEEEFSKKLYMDADDIKKLALEDSLGTHGASHKPLDLMNLNNSKGDIDASIEFLESITDYKIKSISYPYGGESAIPKDAAKVCDELKYGITMQRGVNNTTKEFNRYLLKRIDTNDLDYFLEQYA